jgi:hypothetical protein
MWWRWENGKALALKTMREGLGLCEWLSYVAVRRKSEGFRWIQLALFLCTLRYVVEYVEDELGMVKTKK